MQGGTGGADSLHNPVTVTVLGQEAPVHFAGVMLAMMCMGFTLKAATELGDVAADVMRPVMLAQQTGGWLCAQQSSGCIACCLMLDVSLGHT
jgi:hypothetical protein